MTGESGHFAGSDWHSRTTNRHGFSENRHGYFTNPSICPLFSGMMPIACPEKAAFSTVRRADNSRNGLQPARWEGTGGPDQLSRRRAGPVGEPPADARRTGQGGRTTNTIYKQGELV